MNSSIVLSKQSRAPKIVAITIAVLFILWTVQPPLQAASAYVAATKKDRETQDARAPKATDVFEELELGAAAGGAQVEAVASHPETVVEELDLGAGNDLISKGGGGRRHGGGGGFRMPHIPIGPILDIVRNLPPLRPPVVHGPDPFDDFDIPDIPFDDGGEMAPPQLPPEVYDPPLHEPPPHRRPSTGNLLDENPGLSQAQPPPHAPASTPSSPSAPSTPTAEQLLDESPGINQTQPPPSLSDLQDLIDQNNQVADDVLHGNPGEGTQVAGLATALLGGAVAIGVVVYIAGPHIKRAIDNVKERLEDARRRIESTPGVNTDREGLGTEEELPEGTHLDSEGNLVDDYSKDDIVNDDSLWQ